MPQGYRGSIINEPFNIRETNYYGDANRETAIVGAITSTYVNICIYSRVEKVETSLPD